MSFLDVARLRVDEGLRQVRILEELWKARLEVDVPGMGSGIRARLESSLRLTPLPVDNDVANPEAPLGWGTVRTFVWSAPKLRKVVLSTIAQRPLIEGFALVLLPEPELAAPVFACDFTGLPTRISVNADVYGTRDLGRLPLDTLAPLVETFGRIGSTAGPAWALGLSSGIGLHAKVSPRLANDAFAAVSTSLGRALEAIAAAEPGPGGKETQEAFFRAFHAHGPARGPLRYLYGPAFAERYSRLVFE